NKLLNFLFPIETDFFVVPQGPVVEGHQTIDYSISFDVQTGTRRNGITLLAVELKPEWQVEHHSFMRHADTQMRGRLLDLRYKAPLHTLYGISAFGAYFCIYTMDGLEVKPAVMPN
ncbi:hypothetical protein B0H11DRAFT_1617065, partial [Mycena galericulata]